MENQVENYITIKNTDDNVLNEIQRIFEHKDKFGHTQMMYLVNGIYDRGWADGVVDTHTIDLINGIYDKNWTDYQYNTSWIIHIVGSMWVYGKIENKTEDEILIKLTSVWDTVNPLLKQLCSKLVSIKEDVVIENKWENKSLDVMGIAYYSLEHASFEYLPVEVDKNKFYEDDNYREGVYEMIEQLMDEERNTHQLNFIH